MSMVTAFKSQGGSSKQLRLGRRVEAGLAPQSQQRPSLSIRGGGSRIRVLTKVWYDRGAKIYQDEASLEGACTNCGAMTHEAKFCMDRPEVVPDSPKRYCPR
ncbi:hypothetical protein Leryth_017425 [Lithospermum erythrorhizon]|nr:hypothetical protein Leryth_017425 [Lithospermum erythrorhizon]